MGTFIAAIIAGLIVGPLARLILPGRQNLSLVMTVVLGALGSLLGVFLGSLVFDYEGGPLNFWGLLFGIGGAIIGVLAYGAITGNKGSDRRVTR